MWMPLVDAPIETGPMVFASGSHREGNLADLAISDNSAEYFKNLVIERGFPLAAGELRAGDATFHSGWTLHKAPAIHLEHARGDDCDLLRGRFAHPRTPQCASARRSGPMVPGQHPGDLAASPLNPLLYERRRSTGKKAT